MNALHKEHRGRFRWLTTVEDGHGSTVRTARAELPSGLVVERVETREKGGTGAAVVFINDLTDLGEITLTEQQAAELVAALGELP